jgi:hypothetical protein
MLDEQRTGEQNPLALSLGARPEGTVRKSRAPECGEDLQTTDAIGLTGPRPPGSEDVAAARQDYLERRCARREAVGHGVAHDANLRTYEP